MSTTPSTPSNVSDATTPLTRDELSQALNVEVYDREGKTQTLGELTEGKRSLLIFTRHFWCVNCQIYVKCVCEAIPPSSLPANTQILVIGCGSYQPIDTYAQDSSSAYPIYTDPTQKLHSIFKFKWNLAEGKGGEEVRDYMRDAGSAMTRLWGGIKYGLGHLGHINQTGPKALNGGEILVSAGGECEYIYRMQNTTDHTNVSKLVEMIGAKDVSGTAEAQSKQVEA